MRFAHKSIGLYHIISDKNIFDICLKENKGHFKLEAIRKFKSHH